MGPQRAAAGLGLGLMLAGLVVLAARAATINIDDFSSGSFDISADSGTWVVWFTNTGINAANTIGGRRESIVSWLGGAGSSRARNDDPLYPGEAILSLGAGVSGDVIFNYGSQITAPGDVPLNADFTLVGDLNQRIVLHLASANLSGTVNMGIMAGGSYNNSMKSVAGLGGSEDVTWLFSDFSLDFSDVDGIWIYATPYFPATEWRFSGLEVLGDETETAVPEPSTVLVVGGSLLLLRRLRRKTQAASGRSGLYTARTPAGSGRTRSRRKPY